MYPALRSDAVSGVYDAGTKRLVRAALLVLFTYVFLANAWLGDDAHITFRSVWNFVHGYGLTFNPDERVQASTHPLWMLVIVAAHFVTREFYFTVTVLSWAFCVAAGAILVYRLGTLRSAALLVVWLLSSKAFVDYTSSGLEYPLSYLLLVLFYVRYLDRPVDAPDDQRELRWFVLLATLGFMTRPDAVLLYVVPLGEVVLRSLRANFRRALPAILIGAAPAVLWIAFATFYYGFPLPNTYYAKVANGIPQFLMLRQGLAYLFNSISHDPITLGTIALAVVVAWRTNGPQRRAALSAALFVAYVVWVGGDFMSGRFFAMPFLVGAMIVVPEITASLTPWAAAALVLYNLVVPIVPIKTTSSYDGAWPWRTQNGIKDERGHTHQPSNVLLYSPFRDMPDTPFGRQGLSFGASEQHATVYCCIGLYGLNAGPTKHVIDENALSDPFLARLPVSPRVYFDFWASHYFRDIPEGYVESCERDENLLRDPLLHAYYDRLRNVTRGSVWRADRLRDIWALNLGRSRNIHAQYEKRRPIQLSILANHERFLTDVGERSNVTGVLRATGAPGYLQYGPRIPLKAGMYRVRWVGKVESPREGPIGFVEVWTSSDRRIKRQPVVVTGGDPSHYIAQIDFTIAQPVRALEYRFWVNQNTGVTLERVELFSATAIPVDSE